MRSAPTAVYRCMKARRWDTGSDDAHLPRFDPITLGRWNDDAQYTLYTSHDPDVAVAELRGHLPVVPGPRTVVGSILTAIPARLDYDVVVLRIEVPAAFDAATTWDGRATPASFAGLLDLCGDARAAAATLIANGHTRLIVPSAPRPTDWNSVMYFLGTGQPDEDDLPLRDDVDEVARLTVSPSQPNCP